MGSKKLIVAIIIVVILIIVLLGGYIFLQNNSKQAAILQEEATKLAQTDLTQEEIDVEIKSTGKYAIVEETLKEYLNNARKIYLEVEQFGNNETIEEILSVENIESDREELSVVKQKVDEFEQKLNSYIEQSEVLTYESNIMDKIKSKQLSDYYKDVYKNIMLNEATQEKLKIIQDSVKNVKETANERLEGIKDVVKFLGDNTKYWELSNGKIQFTNVNKLTEYYQLLNDAM